MSALKARVEDGRLERDEPTEGIEDMEAGRTIDARTAVAELRSRL